MSIVVDGTSGSFFVFCSKIIMDIFQAHTKSSVSPLTMVVYESLPTSLTLKWSLSEFNAVSHQELTWANMSSKSSPSSDSVNNQESKRLKSNTNYYKLTDLCPGKVRIVIHLLGEISCIWVLFEMKKSHERVCN